MVRAVNAKRHDEMLRESDGGAPTLTHSLCSFANQIFKYFWQNITESKKANNF